MRFLLWMLIGIGYSSFDDERSVALKTKYALEKGLNGLLIWELRQDDGQQRLLHAITAALENVNQ